MGIWTPRAKPEVCKFTYTPTTRCITGLNYVTIAYLEAHKPCCAVKLLGLAQKSPIAR